MRIQVSLLVTAAMLLIGSANANSQELTVSEGDEIIEFDEDGNIVLASVGAPSPQMKDLRYNP